MTSYSRTTSNYHSLLQDLTCLQHDIQITIGFCKHKLSFKIAEDIIMYDSSKGTTKKTSSPDTVENCTSFWDYYFLSSIQCIKPTNDRTTILGNTFNFCKSEGWCWIIIDCRIAMFWSNPWGRDSICYHLVVEDGVLEKAVQPIIVHVVVGTLQIH